MAKFSEFEHDEISALEEGKEKRGFFAFLDILFKKFIPLININFLYLLFSLPYLALLFWFSPVNVNSVASVNAELQAFVFSFSPRDSVLLDMMLRAFFSFLIVILWGSGPASAGAAYILRNYARQEHAWVWSDFWQTIRDNWKQSLCAVILDILMLYLLTTAIRFYASMADTTTYIVIMAVITFFVLIFTAMHFYLYQLMVTYADKLKQNYRNAFMLALAKLIPNLILIIFVAGIVFALFYFMQLFALIPLVIVLTIVLNLIIQFYASRAMAKLLQKSN